jgi:hypothetical protein
MVCKEACPTAASRNPGSLGTAELEELIDRLCASRGRPSDPFRDYICFQPGDFVSDLADLLLKRAADSPESSREESALMSIGLPIQDRLEWHIVWHFPLKLRLMAVRTFQSIAGRLNDRADHIRMYLSLRFCYRMLKPGHVKAAASQAVRAIRREHLVKFKSKASRNSDCSSTCDPSDPATPPVVVIGSNRPAAKHPSARKAPTRTTVSSNMCNSTKPH